MNRALLFTMLALAGCSQDTIVYPSLAERPAEKRGFAEPEVPLAAPLQMDPELDARLQRLRSQLDEIAKGFDTDVRRADRLVAAASGRAVGSDPWLNAQTALAGLDDWRAQASSLTIDVEGLAAERAATLTPAYPGINELRDAAAAETRRQDEVIKRLQVRLPSA